MLRRELFSRRSRPKPSRPCKPTGKSACQSTRCSIIAPFPANGTAAAVQRPRGSGHGPSMVSDGDVCLSCRIPSGVTFVPWTDRCRRFGRPFRCCNPASVTAVSSSSSPSRRDSPDRCCSPASVMAVPDRYRVSKVGHLSHLCQPSIRDPCPVQANVRQRQRLQVHQVCIRNRQPTQSQRIE